MEEKIMEDKGYELYIVEDEDCESPRTSCDNFGKMHLKHNRYALPLECSYEDVQKAYIKLPVYAYIHSGITLSTSNESYPFNDRWDSGLLGWIVAFKNDILKEYSCKRITKKIKEKAIALLKAEVEEYSKYLEGDCWGWQIRQDGEVIDSCYGYIGKEYAIESGKEMLEYFEKAA